MMSKKTQKEGKKVEKFLKKGQNWSMDLILGIVVFLLILGVFYMLITKNSTVDIDAYKTQGNKIMSYFDSTRSDSAYALITNNEVNMTKLESLYNDPNAYEQIKTELGITGDFCIVLEDSNGRIVVIDGGGTDKIYGFGSSGLNISGCLCGQSC